MLVVYGAPAPETVGRTASTKHTQVTFDDARSHRTTNHVSAFNSVFAAVTVSHALGWPTDSAPDEDQINTNVTTTLL